MLKFNRLIKKYTPERTKINYYNGNLCKAYCCGTYIRNIRIANYCYLPHPKSMKSFLAALHEFGHIRLNHVGMYKDYVALRVIKEEKDAWEWVLSKLKKEKIVVNTSHKKFIDEALKSYGIKTRKFWKKMQKKHLI